MEVSGYERIVRRAERANGPLQLAGHSGGESSMVKAGKRGTHQLGIAAAKVSRRRFKKRLVTRAKGHQQVPNREQEAGLLTEEKRQRQARASRRKQDKTWLPG